MHAGLIAVLAAGAMALMTALTTLAAPASAQEPRIALVIGNGAYESPPPRLINPPQDAELVATALRAVGFDIELLLDADHEAMIAALERLEDRLKEARRETGTAPVALAYFAGHGVEEGGYNYLIPIGARIERSRYYRTRAVSADEVLDAMRYGRARLKFLILDACRNNPLPRSLRQVEMGLAAMAPATGAVIAYSTTPGNVAVDGVGDNSPYAAALAEALTMPGLDYDDMFAQVAELVQADPAAAAYSQLPAYYASRVGADFCFAGCDASPPPQPGCAPDFRAQIEASSNRAYLEGLAAGGGPCASAARARLAVLPAQRTLDARRTPSSTRAPVADDPERLPDFALFKDCADCPEMVVLPSGNFVMGSPESEEGRDDNEGPQRRVTIGYRVAVGRFEVTAGEFQRCHAAGECGRKGGNRGRKPVDSVSWNDAQDYVRWLSRDTGESYRLLTEAEWEYAARGGTTTRYSFGDANRWGFARHVNPILRSAPVGSYPPNPFGLYDVHGNVFEWVEDCYTNRYPSSPTNGGAVDMPNCPLRIARGGSWNSVVEGSRSASRGGGSPEDRSNFVGFRLARTVSP